ncbi:DNA polymerase alpha catalytic subunit A [Trichomonascus vanleenenianus]|uniref:DNA-directed DNA polymerase alpha catalytic subunit POL1 n=1 Tax=Trichomonascus vanleenenianus TaxID=2268995 RepID=UPI003ECA34EF
MSAEERRKKLEALRSRTSKGKRVESDEEDDGRIYDELSAEEYRKYARERLLEDDFVVNDQGEGYVETGADDYEAYDYYSDEDMESSRPAVKKKKNKGGEKPAKPDGDISKMFQRSTVAAKSQVKTSTKEDEDFMEGLLADLNTSKPVSSKASEPRRTSLQIKRRQRSPSPLIKREMPSSPSASRGEDTFDTIDAMDVDAPEDLEDVPMTEVNEEPKAKEETPEIFLQDDDEDDEDEDMVMARPMAAKSVTTKVSISATKPKIEPKKEPKMEPKKEEEPASSPQKEEEDMSWLQLRENIAVETEPVQQMSAKFEEAIEDGKMLFFMMDHEERNGKLTLYGRVKNRTTSESFSSCMLQLTDIYKTVYVLPRPSHKNSGEDVEMGEVYEEIQSILTKAGVTKSFIKPETMKYCFELKDVPRGESEYLKVMLPFTANVNFDTIEGNTFSHVFGANKTTFEEFVLHKKIMGPSWLEVTGAKEMPNASWCQLSASVSIGSGFERSEAVVAVTENIPPPPINALSLSIRTIMNPKNHKQEIMAISGRLYRNVAHDTTTPADKIKSVLFTEVRPMEQIFPTGFERVLKEKKADKYTTLHKSESSLLNKFVGQMQRYDPDVIVGHELLNVHLSILCHRLKDNKIRFWDKMGRHRRQAWPSGFGTNAYEYAQLREITSGRLLCDLSNDMGTSMMPKCSSWSLTEMTDLYLDGKKRVDADINALKSTRNRDALGLYQFLAHNETDTYYTAALAFRIQILALSKQLTNLAGNSWARTLAGSRVDRNEYILLHEFTNQGYIVPDKGSSQKRGQTKDKYKGGLVLDPERGLHKDIVLVMDFNSLYPSIIQEFNICFTTVERNNFSGKEDELPPLPEKSVAMGIFPQLVQNLVMRRREVKKLMKGKCSETERVQWDIKQTALKLTANSMYGCLGYAGSRFYALPLAMLTTFKGREILGDTKTLAEDNGLHVVYGDTDSVMVNTNVNEFKEALRIGAEFKKHVNEQYRYLEIDIDNVFQSLLLVAKKKYAALQMSESNGKVETKMEIKGLDMRRREYCQLSKETSMFVLNEIMYKEDTDQAQETVYSHLSELAENVRNNNVPLGKFIIRTMLGKDPEQYNENDKSPAVCLARRRKAEGNIVKAGDVMQFIICSGEGAPGERAYTLGEIKSKNLVVDADYYLSNQILPTVNRLLDKVQGTTMMQLAEAMGLDTHKYRNHHNSNEGSSTHQDRDLQPLESTIPDRDRFRTAIRLSIRGRCGHSFEFEGLVTAYKSVDARGIKCPECSTLVAPILVNTQLELAIRKEVARYYSGWVVCDDTSCGARTRQINVYGKRCMGQDGDCQGTMRFEYSDKDLYNQLLYFDAIFNMDKAKAELEDDTTKAQLDAGEIARINALAEQNRDRFETTRQVVAKYLRSCGRRYVDMHNIFNFM